MRFTQLTTLCVLALSTLACTPSEMTTADSVALANPASVACVKAGGKLLFRQNTQGEFGMCKLPSGKVCEEWALFRGECA
jgi:putative hemolysin